MTVLVTGAAGFIGLHVTQALLARGDRVVGIDNFNDYYDVRLKEARAALLAGNPRFSLTRLDIADRTGMEEFFARHSDITGIVHLAAQAGVRYSLENPYAYVQSNLMGQVVMLEGARHLTALRHFVYASSSSVYGGNEKQPFAVGDAVDRPVSLYAATKRADELMTRTYSHLYGLPATGLRFFTVYGPWGRPDMAPFLFAGAVAAGRPIRVFNHGQMWRDFTYIDDIVAGVLAALDRPAQPAPEQPGGDLVPHRLYNLGNNRPERLLDFIAAIEAALGRKAEMIMEPMQPGDVPATYADIAASTADLAYLPQTSMAEGVARFIAWYRAFYQLD
ncbi:MULTISPECIES: SDR family NAD(P)-dependent oxidoreductase [unclassified Azospirillum]|uniref:SDR family NAD(P)-dependent oxidoreductase n=1 Tax=unclassified Azospirillum TaxID=2630922 RepID=UPI000B659675|nr:MULTISPECIES: SDR family NAD(P)-dependent oxidoreductase [unclassified Azospirillum]SNS68798.1 UDP-glucuronate 4-epimerase [Azospirillum sp. RU38E]SNS86954.1 UDP-glucuronate 4-epimerase [Azospirillum sp. RU37A]